MFYCTSFTSPFFLSPTFSSLCTLSSFTPSLHHFLFLPFRFHLFSSLFIKLLLKLFHVLPFPTKEVLLHLLPPLLLIIPILVLHFILSFLFLLFLHFPCLLPFLSPPDLFPLRPLSSSYTSFQTPFPALLLHRCSQTRLMTPPPVHLLMFLQSHVLLHLIIVLHLIISFPPPLLT